MPRCILDVYNQPISIFYISFAVTDEMVAPFIDGLTIQEAIEKKILYIVDLSILDGIKCKNDRTVSMWSTHICPFDFLWPYMGYINDVAKAEN